MQEWEIIISVIVSDWKLRRRPSAKTLLHDFQYHTFAENVNIVYIYVGFFLHFTSTACISLFECTDLFAHLQSHYFAPKELCWIYGSNAQAYNFDNTILVDRHVGSTIIQVIKNFDIKVGGARFWTWASCQIRKIAGCACVGNAGNVFPATAG